MTDCNGCGACCDPFVLPMGPVDLGNVPLSLLAGSSTADDVAFYRDHLTPMSRGDGRRMTLEWNEGFTHVFVNDRLELRPAFYYRCDRYDPVAKRCTDYDNRPPVCRGYPWYGRGPDDRANIPPTCSFNEDIGRPVAVAMPTTKGP